MSDARSRILGRVRSALDAAAPEERADDAQLGARIAAHERGIRPERVDLDPPSLIELFVDQATKVNATVDRLADASAIPDALARYLASENLPAAFRMAPHPDLEAAPWSERPALEIKKGSSDGADVVGLSRALSAAAETGTVMLSSGPDSPVTLNFLPETHVIVLRADEIGGTYEECWDVLRAKLGEGAMPRAVTFVTGPSRTGDIEQTIYLGAHGPRRLHILLVDAA